MDEATLKSLMEPLGIHEGDPFGLDMMVGLFKTGMYASRKHNRPDELSDMVIMAIDSSYEAAPQARAAFLLAIFAEYPEVRDVCIADFKDHAPELVALLM